MAFNSLLFIFAFLPLTLLFYYLSKEKYRNLILLLASIFFYFYGSYAAILFVFISIFTNFSIGYLINKFSTSKKATKALMISGVTLNLSLLIYYKYTNFFIKNINSITDNNFTLLNLIIPLGISYITFQQISYIVDIYNKKVNYSSNIINYSLYVLFFPKIVAGPITQYRTISNEITKREYDDSLFKNGITRFSLGLSKKILIAGTLEAVANNIFALDPSTLGFNVSFIGMITYTLQIYFDFAGYTDMAIGIANLFSIKLPENFNKPYRAKGFSDFWKRWHITLSSFLRDYVYIPLGGNRISPSRTILNTIIVFFLSGFWHGASFAFIAWGLYHGFFVVIERLGVSKVYKKLPSILSQLITFLLVAIGWVFFRSISFTYAIKYLLNFVKFNFASNIDYLALGMDFKFWFIFVFALITVFLPPLNKDNNKTLSTITKVISIALLIYSAAVITTGSFMPFIYFNF